MPKPKRLHDEYNFRSYIRKVLKQVHPDTEITSVALNDIDSLVHYVANRIIVVANKLLRAEDKKTLSTREIQDAMRLVLPGELGKHALIEGKKAIQKYAQTGNKERSKRAGLVFPIARTENIIRSHGYNFRISEAAPVYLAAVLEYIAAELCELSGNAARDRGKSARIVPRDIIYAILNDEELTRLFKRVELSNPKVFPGIHNVLLPKSKN